MNTICIGLVGDRSPTITAHQAIEASMQLASSEILRRFDWKWVHTSTISPGESLESFHGIWCVPGSPYAQTDGALWVIEWARTRNVPFLGTCGGFQHAVLEIARHVLGRRDAAHAELDPAAPNPLVAPLACALVEKSERIVSTAHGRFAEWYGRGRTEEFHCSFGLNREWEATIESAGLEIVARGTSGEARAVQLRDHEFFVGTLFQPERATLKGELHPLVRAFLQAATHCAMRVAFNAKTP